MSRTDLPPGGRGGTAHPGSPGRPAPAVTATPVTATPAPSTQEDYLEAVLDLVDRIPAGRVMTYGTVAEVLRDEIGVGGPRQVGQVMARAGSGVPWWRVVNAAGRPPAALRTDALDRLRADGCPLSDDGRAQDVDARVVLRRALWWPDEG